VITLADGTALAADRVIVATGLTPRVGWLAGSLPAVGGVTTDAYCRTVIPDVLAAGDCARWWNPRYQCLMRVEHWDTATKHGAVAARNAMGLDDPFAPVPFFWSVQHGTRLQWAGHTSQWDEVEVTGSPESFVARYRLRGRLGAVFGAGQPRAMAAARRELESDSEVLL